MDGRWGGKGECVTYRLCMPPQQHHEAGRFVRIEGLGLREHNTHTHKREETHKRSFSVLPDHQSYRKIDTNGVCYVLQIVSGGVAGRVD